MILKLIKGERVLSPPRSYFFPSYTSCLNCSLQLLACHQDGEQNLSMKDKVCRNLGKWVYLISKALLPKSDCSEAFNKWDTECRNKDMKSLHYSLEPQCGENLLIKDWQIKWLD